MQTNQIVTPYPIWALSVGHLLPNTWPLLLISDFDIVAFHRLSIVCFPFYEVLQVLSFALPDLILYRPVCYVGLLDRMYAGNRCADCHRPLGNLCPYDPRACLHYLPYCEYCCYMWYGKYRLDCLTRAFPPGRSEFGDILDLLANRAPDILSYLEPWGFVLRVLGTRFTSRIEAEDRFLDACTHLDPDWVVKYVLTVWARDNPSLLDPD